MQTWLDFYHGKKVLVTGHTGFKGSWMCKLLAMAGAQITGYALKPPKSPNLFELSKLSDNINSVVGDIRDFEHLKRIIDEFKPEIIIHMAAQPLVRMSYTQPVYTYEVNVMGTVNLLECIRQSDCVRSVINVTTDKVYKNKEWCWGYREDEELNGFDPYSNSKSCSELVTDSYNNSFLKNKNIAVSTIRAGNVIGGGDFAVDRIIPDCLRAIEKGESIVVRNPSSIRPYEHVLEPLAVYLLIAKAQYESIDFAGSYNVGPDESDCITTGQLVTLFCKKWEQITGQSIYWENKADGGPHEAGYLKLDCSKLKSTFSWKPHWDIEVAIEKIIDWSWLYIQGKNVSECMDWQINEFLHSSV